MIEDIKDNSLLKTCIHEIVCGKMSARWRKNTDIATKGKRLTCLRHILALLRVYLMIDIAIMVAGSKTTLYLQHDLLHSKA